MTFSNKLSFTIFTTGLISLILLSVVIYKYNYDSAIISEFAHTESIASEVSDDINHMLSEKIKTTLTLANTNTIIQALEESIAFYADLPDEKRNESIKQLNEKWRSINDPADNFIIEFTNNKAAQFLKKQQTLLNGEYGEIFLTNKFGALVASTSKLSTFAHGHKYWWKGSYKSGKGGIFFDDRGYDDSVGGYVLGLVVPIKKGGQIIGILKCNLNILGSISKMISGEKHKLFGKFKLTRSGGMVVFEEGFEPLSTRIHDTIYKQLKNNDQGAIIVKYPNKNYLVGFSQITLTRGEKGYSFGGTFESIDHKKGNKGESWYILCYRQMSAIHAPIIESIKSILFSGIAIIFILLIVSYLSGKKIAKPLAILTKATEEIGKGDFSHKINLEVKNEFGNLGQSFNNMTSSLQKATTKLKHEIVERKHAEEALIESEKKYKELIEGTDDLVTIVDKDGTFLFANNICENVFGLSRKDLVGKPAFDFIHPDDHERTQRWFRDCIEKNTDIATIENRQINKTTGKTSYLLWTCNFKYDKEGQTKEINSIAHDITERKQAKEELRQARKMESIGTLVGGVAHDFNNLLYMIVGNTELALEDIPEWNPVHESLEEIKSAGLRAAGIVKQLLNFSRKSDQVLKPIGAVTIIKDALKFLRSTIPSTVKIQTNLPDTDLPILGDPIQINQIMMNLCANASQFMRDTGGIIKIDVETVILNEEEAKGYANLSAGNHINITVCDSGPGIAPDILDRIFDPYFTTKEFGEGSGMGLAVVHGNVKNHGGAIFVDSKPGEGTAFNIFFPVIDELPEPKIEGKEEIPHGTETILFVDDEEFIVNMTGKTLERLGYQVEKQLNPVEALALFKSNPDVFDLVITDMTMPQMTGVKLAEKLKKIRSDMPVIICTGHSAIIDEEKIKLLGIEGLVMKPVSKLKIAKTIRAILDK